MSKTDAKGQDDPRFDLLEDLCAALDRAGINSKSVRGWFARNPQGLNQVGAIEEIVKLAKLKAGAEKVEAEGWRDISTAPKDGLGILCFNPLIGIYNSAFTTKFDEDSREYEGFPCGFWSRGLGALPFGPWDYKPTHWMPLPKPPEGSAR